MNMVKKEEKATVSSPYLSVKVYKNYSDAMKEKNLKRKKKRLTSIRIKSYEEWSGQVAV